MNTYLAPVRSAHPGLDPSNPLDAVRIEHAMLDVMVVNPTPDAAPSRPLLSMAVDLASRMILGAHVSHKTDGCQAALQCLHSVMVRFGTPKTIVTDNGKEFHSREFRAFCQKHGIGICYSQPSRPLFKGKAERSFLVSAGLAAEAGFEPEDMAPQMSLSLDDLQELLEQWRSVENTRAYARHLVAGGPGEGGN